MNAEVARVVVIAAAAEPPGWLRKTLLLKQELPVLNGFYRNH